MEQTDFLELNLPENNDYAGHWDVPLNGSLIMIDDEFEEIATELLTTPANGYAGTLKGSAASLEARLDVGLEATGAIIYNSNDLDKSCHQMDGFETTAIHTRLANVDRREFVNARLRYLQQTVASGEYLKRRESYDTAVTDEITRFATEFGLDFTSQVFGFGLDFNDPIYSGGLEVCSVGWASIAGELFYHKNSCYFAGLDEAYYHVYLSQDPLAVPVDVDYTVDARLIRYYGSTYGGGTYGTGNATINTSIFNVTGIGDGEPGNENNNWQPSANQILRISTGGVSFDEYLIKTVGADSVTIYGEFPYEVSSYIWWILDYTQPCVSVKKYIHSTAAFRNIITGFYNSNMKMLHAMTVFIKNSTADVSFVKSSMGSSSKSNPRYAFIDCSAAAFVNNKLSIPFTTDSTTKIRKLSVVCIEGLNDWGVSTSYSISVDPSRLTDMGLASDILIPSTSVQFRVNLSAVGGNPDAWWNSENFILGEIIVTCNSALGTESWIYTENEIAMKNYLGKQWWGILIEYA